MAAWLKRVALTAIFTGFSMLLSTSYKAEYSIPSIALPCVYKVFEVPVKQTSYGFPMFWLVVVVGVRQIGCGPVVEEFANYFVDWFGFFADLSIYASLCSLTTLLLQKRARAVQPK